MPQRDALLLAEMIDAAEQATVIALAVGAEELQADRLRRDALLWNFTVLGEAAGAVSAELQEAHPDIPWAQPRRLRNRIVHGYWSVDLELLVTTARRDLPPLREHLARILVRLEQNEA